MNRQVPIKDRDFLGLKRELKNWRLQKQSGERIPESLWLRAVNMVDEYSLGYVSKHLGLGWNCLKKRYNVQKRKQLKKHIKNESFIELKLDNRNDVSSSSFSSGCILELRKLDGSVLKVYSNKSVPVNVENLFERFLTCK